MHPWCPYLGDSLLEGRGHNLLVLSLCELSEILDFMDNHASLETWVSSLVLADLKHLADVREKVCELGGDKLFLGKDDLLGSG